MQRQLHRFEEWKLSEIERRLACIEAQRDELLLALDREEGLQSLFYESCARRLAALAREGGQAGREQEAQRATVLDQAARLKTAVRISATLSAAERRVEERELLLDLLEAHLRYQGASLP